MPFLNLLDFITETFDLFVLSKRNVRMENTHEMVQALIGVHGWIIMVGTVQNPRGLHPNPLNGKNIKTDGRYPSIVLTL